MWVVLFHLGSVLPARCCTLYILVIRVHGNQCRDPMNNDKDSDLDSTLRVWNNYWARILFEHWIQAKLSRQSQLKNTRLFKNGTVIINDTSKTNEWDIYCRKFWSYTLTMIFTLNCLIIFSILNKHVLQNSFSSSLHKEIPCCLNINWSVTFSEIVWELETSLKWNLNASFCEFGFA